MEPVDNNQFEIIPSTKAKRKIAISCPTAYLNPGLDLLANEDPMVNTAMEIVPNKKRKRARSCDIAAFENTALDLGISKAAVNEFLTRELENVRKNVKLTSVPDLVESSKPKNASCKLIKSNFDLQPDRTNENELINTNEDITENVCAVAEINESVSSDSALSRELSKQNIGLDVSADKVCIDKKETIDFEVSTAETDNENSITDIEIKNNTLKNESLRAVNIPHPIFETGDLSSITNIQSNITNNIFVNNQTNLSLSFIDRLALDSPNVSSQSLILDDDLNESNIMEIKTITIITKKKKITEKKKKNTNPFLTDSPTEPVVLSITENPFLNLQSTSANITETTNEAEITQFDTQINHNNANFIPRRLFDGEGSNTVVTNESSAAYADAHDYENVDSFRADSPVYENIGDIEIADLHTYENTSYNINKQSKILGYDVSKFSAVDIMNLNKNTTTTAGNCSVDSNDSKKDFKLNILKASNKLSKKVFKTLKKTFKHDQKNSNFNVTLNPYEVPRKQVKIKPEVSEAGIENPALNLDNSNESDIEDSDEEHQYETIKTLRNTRHNMNVTPLKERNYDVNDTSTSKITPSKKVRFDSTLNQEKVITGNSFDYGIASPGFDAKIDKFQDELENCINEKKFIQQNLN